MTITAFAQYTKVSCAGFPQAMDIVQIDYRESSTIVFLKYICQEGITWSNNGEKKQLRKSMVTINSII